MPVVSPARRYSTTSGSTYLPPSGLRSSTTTAGTSKYDYTALTSSYRSTTLNNTTSSYPRSSVYRSSLYTPGITGSSLSRFSVYGTNNDTTTTSNRFGVSSINNKIHSRYSRSSSDSRDTASLLSSSAERKSRYTPSNYKTGLTSTYSHKKPPSGGTSNTNNTLSLNPKHKDLNNNVNNSFTRNKNNNNNNNNCNLIRKSSSSDQVITSKSDQNDLNYVNKSSNLKSSSLALQVATSGLDLYEKYSPSNYIPKCELSRSRSLSEATPTQNSTSIKNNNNNNNNNNTTSKRHSLYSNDSKINNNKKDKDKDKEKINNYDNYNNNDINNDEDKLELSTTQLANKTKIQPISKDQKCTNGTANSTATTATDPITSPLKITGLNYPTANTTNTSTTTVSSSAAASKIITSNSPQINGIQKDKIFSTKIVSRFRDTNFLKTECDLARQQVVKTKQDFETNNNNNNSSNNNNSINGNNNEIDVLNLHPKTFKHKTSEKIAKTTKLLQKQFHNNMNCFQNNLDDIKFIDSDESERQSNSSTATFNNKTSIKLEATKNDTQLNHQQKIHSQKSSTLPITAKRTTNLLNNHSSPSRSEDGQQQNLSVMSRITTFNNKYNTLNEFNRTSTSSSNVRNSLKSNSIQNASNTIGQTITQPILNSLKKSTVIISGNNTGSNSSSNLHNNSINSYNETKLHNNKNTLPNVILNNGHNSVILKNSTSHIPITSSAISSNVVSNNIIVNDSTSSHSSASSSPHIQRRNIIDQNAKTLFFNGITNANTNNALNTNKIEIPSNSNSNNTTVVNVISSDAIDSNDSNKSIKLIINNDDINNIKLNLQSNTSNSNECDNDESIRNTSLRNTTASPSRYYDRDGKLSTLSSRLKDEDEYSSSNKSKSHKSESEDYDGLCGLRNIGNTCFMNSVIQCLSHTCELTKFLKTQNCVRTSTKDQQILCEFAKLIREMWTSSVSTVTPSELKSAFSSKHRMYSGYNQQDAQEFLRFFLDSLHSALNSGSKGDPLRIDETLSDNKIADVTWDWYCKLENSVVRDLFVGQLKSTLRCTVCGNTSVTFDPFWDLSVPLHSSSRCKIEQCLDLFIKEEVLDGDEMPKCSKCRTRRKCTKSFTIQRFPKYLVIHLKRFSETRWSKMTNIVEFPTGERELNMGPYAANPNINVHYSLYAISNHMGSTAGGHYVALCKHPGSKRWHEFNDNIVSDEIPESNLISSSAYLLFFERA